MFITIVKTNGEHRSLPISDITSIDEEGTNPNFSKHAYIEWSNVKKSGYVRTYETVDSLTRRINYTLAGKTLFTGVEDIKTYEK